MSKAKITVYNLEGGSSLLKRVHSAKEHQGQGSLTNTRKPKCSGEGEHSQGFGLMHELLLRERTLTDKGGTKLCDKVSRGGGGVLNYGTRGRSDHVHDRRKQARRIRKEKLNSGGGGKVNL